MKKEKKLLLLLLVLCLLTGCVGGGHDGNDGQPPPEEAPVQQRPDDEPEEPVLREDILLEHLAVEVVVDWEDTERILGELENIRQLLEGALAARGCQVEEIGVTISTAGGFTADALLSGGVDVALLPAIDFLSCASGAAAVLIDSEEPCETVLAVSTGREVLDGAFSAALEAALLETEEGQALLEICRPGVGYLPADETALQAVRELLEQRESVGSGGK